MRSSYGRETELDRKRGTGQKREVGSGRSESGGQKSEGGQRVPPFVVLFVWISDRVGMKPGSDYGPHDY